MILRGLEAREPLRSGLLKWVAPAVALIAAVIIDPVMGAWLGFSLGLVVGTVNPVMLFPLLLVATAFQVVVFIGGLHFGWLVIVGCLGGVIVHGFRTRGSMGVERRVGGLAVLFLALAFLLFLLGGGRLDRLAALLSVMILIAMVARERSAARVWQQFGLDSERAIVYAVSIVGLLVLTGLLSLLASGHIATARAHELGMNVGTTDSSPRSMSNILGLAFVVSAVGIVAVNRNMKDQLFWGAAGLLSLIGLMYTGSRMPAIAGLVAATVGVLAVVVMSPSGAGRRIRRITRVLVIAGLGVGATLILLKSGPGALPFVDGGVEDWRILRAVPIESNVRWSLWIPYVGTMPSVPLMFGAGIGAVRNPHSFFVGTFVTFGLLGLVAVIGFISSLYHRAVKVRSALAIAMLTYVCVAMSTSSDVDRPHFWIMTGLVIVTTTLARKAGQSGGSGARCRSRRALQVDVRGDWG